MLFTIGHSTRSALEFVELLRAYGVAALADVRLIPKSRRHPHFEREALSRLLDTERVVYQHFPDLGGHRRPRVDSPNAAWRNESFRGYADYMHTTEFEIALGRLLEFATHGSTAIMCAEAVWWRCHRQLISDALVARGIEVRHIMSARKSETHTLTSFARVAGGRVCYPAFL